MVSFTLVTSVSLDRLRTGTRVIMNVLTEKSVLRLCEAHELENEMTTLITRLMVSSLASLRATHPFSEK